MMLDVTVLRDRDIIFHDICLNDAVITIVAEDSPTGRKDFED